MKRYPISNFDFCSADLGPLSDCGPSFADGMGG